MQSSSRIRGNAGLRVSVVAAFFVVPLAIAAVGLGLAILALVQPVPQGDPGVDGVNGTDGVNGVDGVNGTEHQSPIIVEYYLNSTATAATVFNDTVSWMKVEGPTINSATDTLFTHSDDRLTYTGTINIIAHGFSSFSYTTANANKNIRVAAIKNGVVIASSIIQRKTGAGGDTGSSAIHFICTLAENDYIEIAAVNLDWVNAGDTATFLFMDVAMVLPREAYVGTIP